MTKRKDQRRELLKQDEFLNWMERSIKYAQENSSKVLTYTIGVVALIALLIGMDVYRTKALKSAASDLYQGEKILLSGLDDPQSDLKFETETEKLEAAIPVLKKVIENQGGEIRAQAQVRLVGALVSLGRSEEALPIYEDLAKQTGVYAILGQVGVGDYHLSKGDTEKAMEIYERGFAMTNGNEGVFDLFKFKIAIAKERSGNIDGAKLDLETIVNKYADDPARQPSFFQRAKDILESLNQPEA